MKLFLILIVTTAALADGQSGCGLCSTVSKATCVGENTFQICEGYPLNPVTTRTFTCPGTKKCSDSAAICSNNVAPSCIPQCRRCSSDNRFACVDDQTFAFCFGEKTPSDVMQRCPDGFVCSIKQPDFCVDAATNKPSCPSAKGRPEFTNTTSITPPTEITPPPPLQVRQDNALLEKCKVGASIPGRYPVVEDPTCQEYHYCYYRGGQLEVKVFKCPTDTIFNSQQQNCVPAATNKCERL